MDTKKLVSELLEQGLTQKELASLACCSQSLISALRNGERGKRLSFQIGDRLNSLHKKMCKRKSKEKPM